MTPAVVVERRKPVPKEISGMTRVDLNRDLRERKRRVSICINSRIDGLPSKDGKVHGPPVSRFGLCADCVEVHRKSKGDRGRYA